MAGSSGICQWLVKPDSLRGKFKRARSGFVLVPFTQSEPLTYRPAYESRMREAKLRRIFAPYSLSQIMNYFFFFLTLVCCAGLAIFTSSQPSLSGENAMGYGLGLAFFGLAFTISGLALTIVMLWKGNFLWVAGDSGLRTTIVMLAWFLVTLTTFFCAVFKWEWPNEGNLYPQFLHWLAIWQGQIWIPLFWFAACFLSLDKEAQILGLPGIMKISLYTGLVIGGVYSVGLLVGYLRESAQQYELEMAGRQQQQDQVHQDNLAFIDAYKSTDAITGLLVYTMPSQSSDVRAAALAKVQTHPNWEMELLALLKDQYSYRDVYYFLEGNKVTHTKEFATALNESIPWLAETIKADITDSNNLQNWSFDMYQIENLLRAIDGQFLDKGVDFVPNITKLKDALNTTPPERFKGVRFNITGVVEAWLRKHKGQD
jgi:hypothetical protein